MILQQKLWTQKLQSPTSAQVSIIPSDAGRALCDSSSCDTSLGSGIEKNIWQVVSTFNQQSYQQHMGVSRDQHRTHFMSTLVSPTHVGIIYTITTIPMATKSHNGLPGWDALRQSPRPGMVPRCAAGAVAHLFLAKVSRHSWDFKQIQKQLWHAKFSRNIVTCVIHNWDITYYTRTYTNYSHTIIYLTIQCANSWCLASKWLLYLILQGEGFQF